MQIPVDTTNNGRGHSHCRHIITTTIIITTGMVVLRTIIINNTILVTTRTIIFIKCISLPITTTGVALLVVVPSSRLLHTMN